MTAQPMNHWSRRNTRTELLNLAQIVVDGQPRAGELAREIVPLIASDCCPNALKLFFDRLVPAVRDGRTLGADVALEALLGRGDLA